MADSGSEASSACGSSETGKLEARLFKTKMCSFYARGKCSRGQACKFAHKASDLVASPDLYRTRPCMVFARSGKCKDGWNCQYAHARCDLRTPEHCFETSPIERGRARSKTGSRAGSNTPTSASSAPEFPDIAPMTIPAHLEPMKVPLPAHAYRDTCPRSRSSSRSSSMNPLTEMGHALYNDQVKATGLSELTFGSGNLSSDDDDDLSELAKRLMIQQPVMPSTPSASSSSGAAAPAEVSTWFPPYEWYCRLTQGYAQPTLPSVPHNELPEDQQTLPRSSTGSEAQCGASSGHSSAATSRESSVIGRTPSQHTMLQRSSSSSREASADFVHSGLLHVVDWQHGLDLENSLDWTGVAIHSPWEVPSASNSMLAAGLQPPVRGHPLAPGLQAPPGLEHPSSPSNAPVAAAPPRRTARKCESESHYWRGLLKPSTIIEIGGKEGSSPHSGEEAQILTVNYREASYKVRLVDGSTKTIKAHLAQPCENSTFFRPLDDISE